MADSEAKVEISIEASQKTGAISAAATDVDGLRAKIEGAGEAAKESSQGFAALDEATKQLTGALATLGTAAAIGDFFKSAVQESIKEAESLRTLRSAIESTGASFGQMSESVERFGQSQQAITRFSDDETYSALAQLTRVTRDVGQAMTATALAQNIAAGTNKSLGESVQLVNDLISGQERAVKSARKELGSFVGDATTNQQALDNLKRSFMGAAEAEESFSKSQAQASHNIDDVKQKIGDALLPVLSALTTTLGYLIKGYEELGVAIGASMAASVTITIGAVKTMMAAQKLHFSEALSTAKETTTRLGVIAEESAADIAAIEARWNKQRLEDSRENGELRAHESVAAQDQAAQKKLEIETKLAEDTKRAVLDEFDFKRAKLDEELQAARDAGVEKLQIKLNGQTQSLDLDSVRSIQELQIAQDQATKLGEIEAKKTADKRAQDKIQAALDEQRKKDIQSTLNFISTLQRAKSKELAAIGKAAAISETIINTAAAVMGAYRSLSWIPVVGPALGASAAALVATAGAAQVAMISGVQLREGGVGMGSPGGTAVTFAEDNRAEAVLPLENPRAMGMIAKAITERMPEGGGGGSTTINLSVMCEVPEWRSIIDRLAEEAQNGSPEIIRLARRLGDLNELHAGRAS